MGDETTLHVRAASTGDPESLSWIVERFSPALISTAERRMRGRLDRHHDPEDIVQDLWLSVLPKLGSLTPRRGRLTPVLMKYLSTALVRRINDVARRSERRSEIEGTAPEAFDEAEARTSAIVSRAVRGEETARLRAELDKLSASDREIIVLRVFEQVGNEEVAAGLAITPNAASVRYHRALARLRRNLPGTLLEELEGPHE